MLNQWDISNSYLELKKQRLNKLLEYRYNSDLFSEIPQKPFAKIDKSFIDEQKYFAENQGKLDASLELIKNIKKKI